MESRVVLATLLLVLITWLLYELTASLEPRR